MRNLFIAVVLAGSLMACMYFGDDPTQTGPGDQSSELSDRGRGHGHHRDAGTDGAPEPTDAGVSFPDGAPTGDAGSFPGGDAGVFPDGAPPDPDAGLFPDGRPY
jgi:hypothetical protein